MDKIQHFEIPVDDVARAKDFYTKCFGWQMQDWPLADGSVYTGVRTGPVDTENMPKESGFINGGMFKRFPGSPVTMPVLTVVVDDLEASMAKIKAAGGSIVVGKKEVPQMGWYCYFKDLEGNLMGLWQSAKPMA